MTASDSQGTPEKAPAVMAEAFPAGGFLAEELEARGLSQAEFAATLGRPVQFVAEVIAGTQDITAEAAELIGAALGTGPQLWLNLQDAYHQWKLS
jgi:HTH-type transcriptional regulator/antitoxin HigA